MRSGKHERSPSLHDTDFQHLRNRMDFGMSHFSSGHFQLGRRLTFPKPSLIWLAFSNVATDLNIRSFGRVERREQLGEVISFTAMRRYCLNVHMHLLDGSWDIMTNSGVLDNDLIDTRFKTQNVISFEPYYK
jgi:hypothetical protein